MIWKRALPGPRVITIISPNAPSLMFLSQLPKDHPLAQLNAVSPTTLFVNSELRKVASEDYNVAFKHQLSKPIYFDSARDKLFFAEFTTNRCFISCTAGLRSKEGLNSDAIVRNVFLGVMHFEDHGSISQYFLTAFKNIERVTRGSGEYFKWNLSPDQYKEALFKVWNDHGILHERTTTNGLEVSELEYSEMLDIASRGITGKHKSNEMTRNLKIELK